MDQLVNFIIRPPRADYSPKDDLLDEEFKLKRRWYRRKDLEVINGQGKKLKCSHYLPLILQEGKPLPCVIYCHGNSGCRADASEVAIILLPSNVTVFTLDFSGSGLSEGEHVTLGWNEKEDLRAVVNHLRSDGSVSRIALWGRSMGAVTSLMYGAEDPSIAGMVLDSPFSNLVELMMELVDTYKYPLPKFTVKLAIQHMRKIIKKKANFDIMDLDTIEVAKRCFVPALFGHAKDDDFIQPHHSEHICDAYMGDKNIIKFDGDHNSPRPQFYFDSVTIFFHNVLNPPDDLPEDDHYLTEDRYFNQDGVYRNQSSNAPLTGTGASTTEDAIAELRSRRLMSRVEVPSGTPTKEKSDASDWPSSSLAARANLTPMMEETDFLEYSFGSYSDIPCTIEDEERMLMEAIMASLKDVKVESSRGEEDCKDNFVDVLSAVPPGRSNLSNASSSSNTDSPNHDLKASREDSKNDVSSALPSGRSNLSNASSSSNTDSPNHDLKAIGEDSKNDPSTDSNPASNSDNPDGTRATLVVQRTRSGTIMDGLTQKLGFNFFKNS